MGLTAQELKEQLGDKAADIIVSGMGVQKYNHRTLTGLCPVHSEKTGSFSWNPKNLAFKCFGCGESFDIYRYYVDIEGLSFIQAKEKVAQHIGANYQIETKTVKRKMEEKAYRKPESDLIQMTPPMITYMQSRGISESTLKFWRVMARKMNFARKGQPEDIQIGFAFPCYDEFGEHVHTSYRSKSKQLKQSYETKSIIHGMWHVDQDEPLMICEGQIDAMTIWKCGFKNVVSVPGGASNVKFLENNYEWLERFPQLIYWADDDEAGRKMASFLQTKFDNVKIIMYKGAKDANEALKKDGEAAVKEFLQFKPELPPGIKTLKGMAYSTEPATDADRIETGFRQFDEFVDDWRTEQLSIVFGRDGEGKSTFVSQIITHQMIKGKKTFLYSAELGEQGMQDWLFKQLIGDAKDCYTKKQDKYNYKFFIKPYVLQAIKEWGNELLYLVDRKSPDIQKDQDVLIKTMKTLAKRHGVKLFIVDNLQAVMHEDANTLYSDQANFVQACADFAASHNVHVILVAHPKKVNELKIENEEPDYGVLEKTDVSGTKGITNKAHNIVSVERDFNGVFFDMIVTNLKDKNTGNRKAFKYLFSKDTFRFYNDVTPEIVERPWEKLVKEYKATAIKDAFVFDD